MLDRVLDSIASTILRRRRLVIAVVLGMVGLLASQLPRLRAHSSPEELMISDSGYPERAREHRALFGDADSVVVLLVAAEDVTSVPALQHVHDLARHFGSDASVERVDAITTTPLPGAAPGDGEAATLETLEVLPEEARAGVEAILERLIAADPSRFPMGLHTIAERVGPGDFAGAVRGEVVTPEDAARIRAALEGEPLVIGRLISRDRRLAAVVLTMAPELGTGAARIDAVHAIDAWLAAHPPPAGIAVHAAGIPHVRAAIQDAMIADQLFLVPLSLLLCVVLLYLSFRWIAGVILPIAMVALTIVATLGALAAAGEPLSILMNTLPTLLVIMGIAEAVHLVGRYLEEAQRSSDRVLAARRALRGLLIACFLTSFTTAAGFGALAVAQTEMLRRFGLAAALGVMIGYAILVTWVPAALPSFSAPPPLRRPGAPARTLDALLVRVTAAIVRRPVPLLAATLLAMLPCAWTYASIHVDTALLETFDEDDPIAVSTRLIERHLDGILPLEVHVRAPVGVDLREPAALAALDRVAGWARSEPGVLRATGPADVLWEVWRPIAGIGPQEPRTSFRSRDQVEALIALLDRARPNPALAWLSSDGRHARIEVRLADVGARRSIALIDALAARVREELAAIAPGIDVSMLGEALVNSRGVTTVVDDLFGSLGLSALVIFVTIGVLFRSARLGLLAIPPNVIPQIGTVAWMVLRGIPLNAGTAIVFSVAIGVSVDLTIHGFARMLEEERRGMARRAALVRVARSTGRAMVLSSATLVLGFSVLLGSGFVPVRHFGELIAVALTISLVTSLAFQPAMLMLLGPRLRGGDV